MNIILMSEITVRVTEMIIIIRGVQNRYCTTIYMYMYDVTLHSPNLDVTLQRKIIER